MSEIAIHSLLVDWKQRGLDRETHQDPDRDRYTSDEEGTVVDNAADELELIAVSKRPTRLLPHGTVVRTNLEPSVQEAMPLKKIWCVKLMDNAHAPEIMSGQMNVVKTYLKARYRLSDLLRAQRNDRRTSSLKRWIENGAPDKGDLEEDSYKILKQFYLKRNDLLYLNKDGIVGCKRKEEDKVLYKYNSIVLPQLYQTKLLFRSHDQMGHQGVDKVYNRIQKRFEWPGLKKACEKWIAACLSCQQAKDPRNDGNEVVDDCDLPLDLELTERVEVDDETLPYAEEDWDCPEQIEIDKKLQPDFPLTMETRQSKRGKNKKKYNPYGEDFVVDRIVVSDVMDSLVGLDEVAMLEEIDLVNDMDQDWIDDRSEPEVEFEPEAEQTHEQELTNLRVLEWLHDLPTDPKETILTIQDVDKDGISIKYISHDLTESNWVAPDGPLRVPQSNLNLLDFGRSTGTSMDIFVRGVGVGLTHTENLIKKK